MYGSKLTTRQRHAISAAALVVAVIMIGDLVYQLGVHRAWGRWIPETLAAAPTTQPAATQPSTAPAPEESAKKKSEPPEVYLAIRKRNVFTPHHVAQHGMTLTGVLGQIALFAKGDQTIGIELGKTEQGVKVVEIKNYEVTIEYQGKNETMKLFSDSPAAPKADRTPRPEPGKHKEAKVPDASADVKPTPPSAPEPVGEKTAARESEVRRRIGGRSVVSDGTGPAAASQPADASEH